MPKDLMQRRRLNAVSGFIGFTDTNFFLSSASTGHTHVYGLEFRHAICGVNGFDPGGQPTL